MPRKGKSVDERLSMWKLGGPDGTCWEYTGLLPDKGYARMEIKGKAHYLHRLSYQRAHPGEDINQLHIRHKCDNPKCINPSHLEVGTHKDNMHDKALRGRAPRMKGEDNPQAKLTEAQVLAIRESDASQRKIAKQFGISRRMVGFIQKRIKWGHI